MGYESGERLFHNLEARQLFDGRRSVLKNEIEALTEARLFGNSFDDVVEHFIGKGELEPLTLYLDRIEQVEDGEIDYQFFDHSWQRNVTVRCNYYVFAVPFTGEAELFKARPSRFFFTTLIGVVYPSEVRFSFILRPHEVSTNVKQEMDRTLGQLQEWIESLCVEVKAFNQSLPGFIRDLVNKRHEKLERDRSIRTEIGYPIRQRPNVSAFTPIPLVVKRPPKPLQTRQGSFSPEPALLDEHYNHILGSLQNMSEAIERSPATYADLSETDIRNILLVSLNNSYEGNATGETFTKQGKSDIFITEQGKCIFIAECKIWKGPASLSGAIDQLLGYATWRNTKTAILLFNKNKRVSEVTEKIAQTVEAHAQYKRTIPAGSEKSFFRFAIKNKEHPDIEIQLAVLVFDIPSGQTSEGS